MPTELASNTRQSAAAISEALAQRTQALPAWAKYGLTLLIVAAATWLRLLMDPWLGQNAVPYITFNAAVVLAAFLWGRVPGIVATLAGALACDYFIGVPRYSFLFNSAAELLPFALFIITGLLVSLLAGHLHTTRLLAQEQRRLLAVTLTSIGDGVIVTDPQGRVTFLNKEAEQLTGWANHEAQGQDLASVFHIVNEATRQPVESPVDKVLRLGTVVGLANHTLLIAKDGREIPIDDSGAPIRQADGTFQGVVLVFRDFSERKQAEVALRQANEKLQTTINSITDGLLLLDHDWRYTFFSETGAKLIGMRREDLMGACIWELFPQTRATRFYDEFHRAVQARQPVHFEELFPEPLNKWLACHCYPNEAGLAVYFHDITERKRAEEALRESRERLDLALSSSRMATFDWDIISNKRNWSTGVHALLGTNPQSFTGAPEEFFRVMPPEDRHTVQAALARAVDATSLYETEYRAIWPDGSIHYIAARGKVQRDTTGRAVQLTGVCWDITDRKRVEEALAVEQANLQTIFNSVDVGMLLIDGNGQVQRANRTLARWIDKDPAALCGGQPGDILGCIHGLDHPKGCGHSPMCGGCPIRKTFQSVLSTGQAVHDIEAQAGLSIGGREVNQWLNVSADPVSIGGKPHAILALNNITERKHVEMSLRQSEERYRSLFGTMIEGFCIIEVLFDAGNHPVDYRFLEINPAFETQTGLHNAQGKRIRELAPDNEEYWFEIYGKVALTGEPIRFINEAKALHRWYDVSAYRVGDEGSHRVAILFNDISQRKQDQEALQQANAQLERRVAERTAQLASANAGLRDQMDAYQRLEAEVAKIVEDERVQLGMELHDNLCQQIAATGMLTATLAKRLREDNSPLADTAGRIVASLGAAGGDAHALARGLLPVQVEADGLMVALAGLAQRTTDMQDVACAFECAAPVPVKSNAIATHLFRIAQEAIHNAIKHGQAKHIVVTLTNHDGMALTVYDDGIGISAEGVRAAGSGLRIMAYRARIIDAALSVQPAPTGGTMVRCILKEGVGQP